MDALSGLRVDPTWVARLGEEIAGVSRLSYPPRRGAVMTDWTGTSRRVRTDNDFRNAPILHLNESMGYRHRSDMIQLFQTA